MATSLVSKFGKKWIRWYDVADIVHLKEGTIQVHIKKRKGGILSKDTSGNQKIIKRKLKVKKHKKELKSLFLERQENFYNIIIDIFNRNKVETAPSESDSIM